MQVKLCVFLQTKEAKRLKEFLEDYDDDRDDPKYYRYKAIEIMVLLLFFTCVHVLCQGN